MPSNAAHFVVVMLKSPFECSLLPPLPGKRMHLHKHRCLRKEGRCSRCWQLTSLNERTLLDYQDRSRPLPKGGLISWLLRTRPGDFVVEYHMPMSHMMSDQALMGCVQTMEFNFKQNPGTWDIQLFRSIDSSSAAGLPTETAGAAKMGLTTEKFRTVDFSIQVTPFVHATFLHWHLCLRMGSRASTSEPWVKTCVNFSTRAMLAITAPALRS